MLTILRFAACVALAGGAAMVSLAAKAQSDQPRDHVIIVGPEAKNMSEKEPAHLSIRLKNRMRWMALGGRILRITFPADGFPILVDGTRVTLPPLSGMNINESKTRWFPGVTDTGMANSDLLPLISRAPNHELVYRYRVSMGNGQVNAVLVIQE